jgi:hypothetical protein
MIARARLAATEGDADFYRAKIVTARFYADHMLPLAAAHKHQVVDGAASVLALEEALL